MSKKISQQFNCSRMMLPEHQSRLNDHAEQTMRREKYRRPFLDEQYREELQYTLEAALTEKKPVMIIAQNSKGYQTVSGILRCINTTAGTLYIDTGCDNIVSVKATEVITLAFSD